MTHIFKHFSLTIALMIGTAYAMDIAPQEIHSNPPAQLAEDGLPADVNERNEFLVNYQNIFEPHNPIFKYYDNIKYSMPSQNIDFYSNVLIFNHSSFIQDSMPLPNNPFYFQGMPLPDSETDKKIIIGSLEHRQKNVSGFYNQLTLLRDQLREVYSHFQLNKDQLIGQINNNTLDKFEKLYKILNKWSLEIMKTTSTMKDLAQKGKFPADYYMPRARKNAHDLIGASKFQKDSYHNQEVIVLDSDHTVSTYLNYTNKENPLDLQMPPKVEHPIAKGKSHSTSVSGIVGARNTPTTDRTKRTTLDIENHFKGVAPGVSVTPIGFNENIEDDNNYVWFSKKVLTELTKTKARVINMSAQMPIYMPCLLSDRSQLSPDKQAACRSLDQFFNIIKTRDMILVQAAGNEGLMLEKVDPQTGKPETDLRLGVPGLQYFKQSDPYFKNYRKNWVDLTDVAHTIPQLKDRVIFVGNLMANGIVPDKKSSLPGAFASDFIFAPSDDIYTLSPMEMDKDFTDEKKEDAKRKISSAINTLKSSLPELPEEAAIQSLLVLINPKWAKESRTQEFGQFGGTSGAAPRVSGALIILHQKFPDLPMTTIRKCLLESGYPFWKELPKKLFAWVRRVSMNPDESLTDYGKMLFGHGRIDVEAAYHACLSEQEKLRARPWTGNKKK